MNQYLRRYFQIYVILRTWLELLTHFSQADDTRLFFQCKPPGASEYLNCSAFHIFVESQYIDNMSRGFVKEDDQEEIPFVPPRADLPEGVPNYVTQQGMNELLEERAMLIDEKSRLDHSNENEKRIALNHLNSKLHLLDNRIATAQIVEHKEQGRDEIKFGAVIRLRIPANNSIQTFQITGVDEADVSKGKIAFTSPLAKALINKKIGDKVTLKRDLKDLVFEVIDIS